MGMLLSFGEDGMLTTHEAFALAMLIGASGTAAGLALAERIQGHAVDPSLRHDLFLDDHEAERLLASLRQLRRSSLPSHLLLLEEALIQGLDH